jgi:hypothetical protein
LFDDVIHECDDDVVAETALARTIIVHDVAEPVPARFHQFPRTGGPVTALVIAPVLARLVLQRTVPSGYWWPGT